MEKPHHHELGSQALLILAAIGIVFGDIGTSPLYALRECFSGHYAVELNDTNVFGILSLIFWSLVGLISLKYLQFVMRATNRGEGGVLALTALACLRQRRPLRWGTPVLMSLGLFGAALLVGDGMITPAISVMSAVEGLAIATPVFQEWVAPATIAILILLFSIQRFGTSKIGSLFGPIVILWFATIGLLGLASIAQEPRVLAALNPYYALKFFYVGGAQSYFVLASVFLAVTGGEALYADIGHFGRKAISRGWYFCALPGLVLNYFGQGALLLRAPEAMSNPFFYLAPSWGLMPLAILAMVAAVIASQALISGLFSMAQQCTQLGYWPRLQIIHTNEKRAGQIYVPAVNWMLMIGTIWLVIEFDTSSNLSAAYGMGISIIVVISSILASVVAWTIWGWKGWRILAILTSLLFMELAFLGANTMKIKEGGWVPLLIGVVMYYLMTTWKRGRASLIQRLRAHSYPFAQLLKDIETKPPVRVHGTAIYMVGDVEMTPPTLMHNLRHNKVLHENIVFLTVINREVPHVPENERMQVTRLAPSFFRVIAYYGFSDTPDIPELLQKCSRQGLGLDYSEPTYFLGREILKIGAGRKQELSFFRKNVFAFMAKNATVATAFFRLPQEDVIEVGMEIEI